MTEQKSPVESEEEEGLTLLQESPSGPIWAETGSAVSINQFADTWSYQPSLLQCCTTGPSTSWNWVGDKPQMYWEYLPVSLNKLLDWTHIRSQFGISFADLSTSYSSCVLRGVSNLWETSEQKKGSGEFPEPMPFLWKPESCSRARAHMLSPASDWHSINLACGSQIQETRLQWSGTLTYRHTLLHLRLMQFRHWPCLLKISTASS